MAAQKDFGPASPAFDPDAAEFDTAGLPALGRAEGRLPAPLRRPLTARLIAVALALVAVVGLGGGKLAAKAADTAALYEQGMRGDGMSIASDLTARANAAANILTLGEGLLGQEDALVAGARAALDDLNAAEGPAARYEANARLASAVDALYQQLAPKAEQAGKADMLKRVPAGCYILEEKKAPPIKLAIIGKPNAGKSSIVNAVLGKDRVIVSDVSGTTRDTIDSTLVVDGTEFVIVDTAGIRKKSKVDYGVEKFAVDRAIKAISRSDISVLVVDALEGLTEQDKKIAELTIEAGRGLIIAVNKWDIVEDKDSNTADKFKKEIRSEAPFLDYAPIIFISAKTKLRLNKIFSTAVEVYASCNKRVSTSLLNKVVNEAFDLNPPLSEKGKRAKIYYSTQTSAAPPSFVIFVNNSKLLKDSYKRYLERKMREAFGFLGTPIRIIPREKSEKAKKK